MKSRLLASVLGVMAAGKILAVPVDITPATANLSVDLAADASTPGWATLPNLVVAEKTNNPGKESISGSGTLILTAPAGFEFNIEAVLSSSFSGPDLTGVSATVTSASTITITLTVGGVAGHDSFTISGIQARPISGVALNTGSITRTGGTATIDSGSAFGTLTEVGGAATVLEIATQPSTSAVAGEVLVQQPVVNLRDQFGHVASDSSSAVAVSVSAGDVLGTSSVIASSGVVTFTDIALTHVGTVTLDFNSGSLATVTSDEIVVTAGAPKASALVITTQPSANAVAGEVFAQQPALAVYDQYGNPFTDDNASIITATRLSGAGDLQGTLTANVVNGVATFTDLSHEIAGDISIEFTSGSLSNAVSETVTVSPAAAASLVFSVQPANALVGIPFGTQPVVKTVDAFGNDSAPADAAVELLVSLVEGSGPLSGTTSANIGTDGGNGEVTFTDLQIDSANAVNRLAVTAAGLNAATSEVFAVSSVIPTQISMQIQPSTTAVAGEVFASQPVLHLLDAQGNLAAEDNSTVVTASASSGSLVGILQATAVNGVVTFSDLSHQTAGTLTLNFSAIGLTGATSDEITVSPANATTLVFTTSPGVARVGSPFGVQPALQTVDDFGNASNIGLPASAPVELTLTSGTGTLLGTTVLDIGTDAGNGTIAFSDLQIDVAGTGKQLTATNDSLSSATSATFIVGGVVPADAIVSVDTATSGSVMLNGPVYYEAASGDVAVGTIILNAPAGFEFVTTGQTPRVQIHRIAGPNGGGINGINTGMPQNVTSVTSTQITYNITQSSTNGTVNSITWSQIRVRALSGNGASGDITKTGTATMATVVDGVTSFGHLETSAGAFAQLAIQTQPSPAANAGVPFAQQPVLQIQDQFGNAILDDNTTSVTAIANGSASLSGNTMVTATNGLIVFTDLAYNAAETITITFSNATANVTSDEVLVGAGPVSALVFTSQPVNGVAGLPFPVAPVVQTVDQFGNQSLVDLPETLEVTLSLTSGAGPLSGTTTLDIGTSAGNGTVTFSDLQIGTAAEVNQLTASAGTLGSALSDVFAIVAADHLEYVEGDGQTAVAGNAVAINPTVKVVDINNNPITGATVVFTVQNGGGNVSQSVVFSDTNGLASTVFTLGGELGDSNQVLVASSAVPGQPSSITFYATATVAEASRLAIATQPSASAVAGEVFAQQPVVRIEDAFGNLIADDNTTVVTVAVNTGTGTLNGTLEATAVNGVATFTDLSYNVAEVIDLVFSASGLTNAISETITVAPAPIAALAFTTQPGDAYTNHDLEPQPVVKTQDVFGNDSTNGLPESLIVSVALTSGSGELLGTTNIDVGSAAFGGVAAFTDLQVTTGGIDKQLTATAENLTDAISEEFRIGGVDPGITALIPANGTSVPMAGPAYYELNNADVSAGTIVLNAPAGFEFDTAFSPVVRVQRIGGIGNPSNNINGASNGEAGTTYPVTISSTQLTFTVTSSSVNGVTSSLKWENVYVRYAPGSTAGSGEVTKSGNSVMATVIDGVTSFATLNGEPKPSRIVIVTQPSASATAGIPFAQQPIVRVEDQYGNVWTNDVFTITAARNAGSGDLQGTLSVQTVDGIATFATLGHNVAGTITITFTGENLQSTSSANIVVSPAAADHLHFTTQPGSGVAGASLSVQPVVRSFDQFGNASTVGLGAAHIVSVALNSGTGSLIGTTTVDIGTAAGNGTATFTNLGVSTAGEKTLIASAPSLTSEVSESFTVTSDGGSGKLDQTITFDPLADKVFGEAPFTVSATASSGLPVTFSIIDGPASIVDNTITLTGVGTVIVQASQDGNEVYNPADSVVREFDVTASGKLVKGDINGDDEADILFQDGQVIGIWYMNGTNFVSSALLRDGVRDGANWRVCGQADFTGDGKQDLLFQSFDGRLAIWEMDGSAKVQAHLLDDGSQVGGRVVAVADMDNDQTPDIILQRVNESPELDGAISILFMDGLNFRSGLHVRGNEALGWRVRAAGDLDGDTVADLIVQHVDGRLQMWKGADYATVVELHGGVPVASRVVGSSDFNGDGQLDLLFRTPANRLSVWLMDGSSRISATFLREGRSVDTRWTVVGPR